MCRQNKKTFNRPNSKLPTVENHHDETFWTLCCCILCCNADEKEVCVLCAIVFPRLQRVEQTEAVAETVGGGEGENKLWSSILNTQPWSVSDWDHSFITDWLLSSPVRGCRTAEDTPHLRRAPGDWIGRSRPRPLTFWALPWQQRQ